ncbi:MAG TPA: diguanylate cyclase, partial [Gammaproteobacteria bacterium]|nr:diguanylate cyclase [Gammaproteobacteria bacterium]
MNRRALSWAIIALAIFASLYLLDTYGYLVRLEYDFGAARARLLAHRADSDIVIVGIDGRSLKALDEWPWPRRRYARLLQQLEGKGVASLFLDIDFSSPSDADDDSLLEQALASWTGPPVLLASLWQPVSGTDGTLQAVQPLPRFARYGRLASVMLEPDVDGLVRAMRSSWGIGGLRLRSVLYYQRGLPDSASVPIDFSILPSSFDYVSFIDLLDAKVDFDGLKGKNVYVGAIATELNDIVPVPLYKGGLPGVVVQALAAESARAGVLHAPPAWLYAALLILWTALLAAYFGNRKWRRSALVLGGGLVVLCAASIVLYGRFRIDLHIVAPALIALALFTAATLRSLDYETWRALAYALGLKRRDALLRSIVESSTDCILCVDGNGLIRTVNPAAATLFERASDDLLGTDIGNLIPALAGGSATLAALAGAVSEHEGRRARGRSFPVEISVSRVALQDEPLYTAIVRDVSERQVHERELEHRATHDSLTGLPNRAALSAYLDSVLAHPTGENTSALLMLDLCRFKEVNDTLGHDVGDEVLREAAQRFGLALTARAFIGRIGGDEFAVVLPEVRDRIAIEDLAQKLVETLKTPIYGRGIAIEIGLSIGVALWPEHAHDAQELLRHADVAMYVAKRQGSSYEYYDPEHDRHSVRRLAMLSELRGAIARDEIALHYQPQVNLQTGLVEGVEALLRWRHAAFGTVSPGEFVILAESTDLIQPLTEWTLIRALRDALAWRERELELRIAVNLSARVLQVAELPDRLAALLAPHAFD